MPQDFAGNISPESSPQEQLPALEQESLLAERGEAETEAGEMEKPPERVIEEPPVRTTQPALAKDEDKVNVLKEAEKLRDINIEGRKIEHLVNLAQSKGVDFAIEVAKKTDDACLLDLFHDELVKRKLHP